MDKDIKRLCFLNKQMGTLFFGKYQKKIAATGLDLVINQAGLVYRFYCIKYMLHYRINRKISYCDPF